MHVKWSSITYQFYKLQIENYNLKPEVWQIDKIKNIKKIKKVKQTFFVDKMTPKFTLQPFKQDYWSPIAVFKI